MTTHNNSIVGSTGAVVFPTGPGMAINVSGWAAQVLCRGVVTTECSDAWRYCAPGELSVDAAIVGNMVTDFPPIGMWGDADPEDPDLRANMTGVFVLQVDNDDDVGPSTISFSAMVNVAELRRSNVDSPATIHVSSIGPVTFSWAF